MTIPAPWDLGMLPRARIDSPPAITQAEADVIAEKFDLTGFDRLQVHSVPGAGGKLQYLIQPMRLGYDWLV